MKFIITGFNGTVGSSLQRKCVELGHQALPWRRDAYPVGADLSALRFLEREEPHALFHLAIASQPTGIDNEPWRVNCEWPGSLAAICHEVGIPFVFSSTVMVFAPEHNGPFTSESQPDTPEGYGFEKRLAENKVMAVNANARIARLGWQIGDSPGSNNMIDFLESNQRKHGSVNMSRKWLPACSFLQDTATALLELLTLPSGVYMLDSNRGWSFAEICAELNKRHGERWRLKESEEPDSDQRMLDDRLALPALREHLSGLREIS